MGYPKTIDMVTALKDALNSIEQLQKLAQEFNHPSGGIIWVYANCAAARLTEILDEHDPLREVCPIPDNFDKLFRVTAKLERK